MVLNKNRQSAGLVPVEMHSRTPHLASARARFAAALSPGDAARGGRRVCACQGHRRRGGRGHAGACRALRPGGIRRGAGAGRAAADGAARLLRRHGGAPRRAAGACAAGAADQLCLARCHPCRWRSDRRRPAGLAGRRGRDRAAGLAGVRCHHPHGRDGRRGGRPAPAGDCARGGRLRRSGLRPAGREFRAPPDGRARCLAGQRVRHRHARPICIT